MAEDYGVRGSGKRRRYEYEEYEEECEEEYDGGASKRRSSKRRQVSVFIDDEAIVDSDEEEEDEEDGDGFIVDDLVDTPEEEGARDRRQRSMYNREEDDLDEFGEYLKQKYDNRSGDIEYEEATDAEQQALLPSVRDPKLFMVKCAIGKEREAAVCLMQKYIDKGSELQIRSAVALDHLKNFIYVEADKESHVREAIKGMRNLFGAKITIVPIKEMVDLLPVESKSTDIARDMWVRMKSGNYKGDLAKVFDVDNVKQRVTVKLIPRVDLQELANKLDGRDVTKKNQFVIPRLMNTEEARGLHIRVERRKDQVTGEYYEIIDGQRYKDGFLMKPVSMKTISTQNVQPTFDELEKFRQPSEGHGDMSTVFANWKKGHFMKGDAILVIKGDLKNLKGRVEKSEEDYVHIKPNAEGLPKTLALNKKDLCKYFEPGNLVKVVSGVHEGATGLVLKVEGHVLIILSDTTKEDIRVFADHVVESSEGITKMCGTRSDPGRLPPRCPMNFGRGQHNSLVGKIVKVRLGPYKGYRGRVKDVKGNNLRIELDSTMKDIMVDRNHITDNVNIMTNPQNGLGSETPMYPSRTPMHRFMTPMRDYGGSAATTLVYDGMRTPMRGRAWNPYATISPTRMLTAA